MSVTIQMEHICFSVLYLHLLYDGILSSGSKHGDGENMFSLSVSKHHAMLTMCAVEASSKSSFSISLFKAQTRLLCLSLFKPIHDNLMCIAAVSLKHENGRMCCLPPCLYFFTVYLRSSYVLAFSSQQIFIFWAFLHLQNNEEEIPCSFFFWSLPNINQPAKPS